VRNDAFEKTEIAKLKWCQALAARQLESGSTATLEWRREAGSLPYKKQ
jgi:hypothetical protein